MTYREKFHRYWGACRAAGYDISQGQHLCSEWAEAELHDRAFPQDPVEPFRILRALVSKRRAQYWTESRRRQATLSLAAEMALYEAPCK